MKGSSGQGMGSAFDAMERVCVLWDATMEGFITLPKLSLPFGYFRTFVQQRASLTCIEVDQEFSLMTLVGFALAVVELKA